MDNNYRSNIIFAILSLQLINLQLVNAELYKELSEGTELGLYL